MISLIFMIDIHFDKNILQDAINITNGAYAPLAGFLREKDFLSVVENMRLADGRVWPIPIVLDIGPDEYKRIKNERRIDLADDAGKIKAVLDNIEIYKYNKEDYARKVFGTTDINHPGVAEVMAKGDYLVGGDISFCHSRESGNPEFMQQLCPHLSGNNIPNDAFALNYTPEETRKIFKDKGWKTVVAFQTRNVPHRSHEHLQKRALAEVDGLFIQPVIGKKKAGDFKDEVIIEGYKILLEKYYPEGKYFLGILPIKMNYAGPREAVMHALIRKNYGCTHMIIGRDHAGVGNYYERYAAHKIFNEFDEKELGVKILKYEDVSHCKACEKLTASDECEHGENNRVFLSGTKIREMVKNGEPLPEELIRREISELLLNHPDPFV